MFAGRGETLARGRDSAAPIAARCISLRATPACPLRRCCVILKITKQSLNRVLNDLLAGGYVERKPGCRTTGACASCA